MTIFLTFLFTGLLTVFCVKRNLIEETYIPYLLMGIYAVSITPSLQIPYMIDDTDHLFQLARAMESSTVFQWMFTPHNEHTIPFLRLLYYVFYKYFWLHPQPFHLAVIAVCTGILCISYHLLFKFTNSKYTAFLGITLLASSNLPDMAIFVTTNSHIIFCLFFLMLLFYAQYQYCTHKSKGSIALIILSALLAPLTFALGILSLVFAFLFEQLCIPKKLKSTNGSTMMYVFIGWLLGFIPYLITLDKIVYSDQYKFVGATSSFQVMNIWLGAKILMLYFYHDLIPGLLPNLYLSMAIFFLAVSIGYTHRKHVDWKRIIFFLITGFTFNFIIYIFRVAWGPKALSVSRYDVFPGLMLCMIYIILLNPFLKKHAVYIASPAKKTIIYCCAFLLISYSGMLRYNKANRVCSETYLTIQRLNIDLKTTTVNYFKEYPHVGHLTLKNRMVFIPRLPSLLTKRGFYPYPTRYARPLSFYNQYVVPEDIRKKITYAKKTDPLFLDYIKAERWQDNLKSFTSLVE